jgi:hypothetical protein
MHFIIEFLPLLFGVFWAQLFHFTKEFASKNFLFITLNVLSGFFVNWLSKEGIEFVAVDILLTLCSYLAMILLTKYFIKRA